MRILEIFNPPKPCSYLPDELANFRYFYIENCTAEFYLALLERGWRRFGRYFFAPICDACERCISVRKFCLSVTFSQNERRVLKAPLQVQIRRPHVSEEHLELHAKYHAAMSVKKGWSAVDTGLEHYYQTFVQGAQDFGVEFDFYFSGKLVGVAYSDIIGNRAISAGYCFYDHDFSRFSIGTFSILTQISLASRYNIRYFYPGYWIENHACMGYKARFAPYQVLHGRPGLDEMAIWEG